MNQFWGSLRSHTREGGPCVPTYVRLINRNRPFASQSKRPVCVRGSMCFAVARSVQLHYQSPPKNVPFTLSWGCFLPVDGAWIYTSMLSLRPVYSMQMRQCVEKATNMKILLLRHTGLSNT